MSKLLINEQPLQFLPTLAKILGNSDKALMLQQINYWLNNPKVGKEANGHRWIRNTVEDWHTQFPWIAAKTVQRYLKDLEEKRILLTCNLNKLKFDRTKWYTIDYDELDKLTNANGQSDQMEGDSQSQRKGTKSPTENRTTSPSQKGTSSPKQYHRLPETTSKTTTENKGQAQPAQPSIAAQRREVVEYLNQKTGKHFKPNADGNKRIIEPRLKEGYTVDEMKKVIDNMYSLWHEVTFRNGEPGDNYLKPETLFRSSKIDGYLNATPSTANNQRQRYGKRAPINEPMPEWFKHEQEQKEQSEPDQGNWMDQLPDESEVQ